MPTRVPVSYSYAGACDRRKRNCQHRGFRAGREEKKTLQRCERGASARVPELDEVVFAPRHEQPHSRVPLDALDVPPVSGKHALFAALGEGPHAHGRVVARSGEPCVVWRETEPAHGLPMCRPRSQVVHVRLEVLDDAGLVGRRDVGACVVEGQRADGGVVCLENGLEVEGEAVPCCEFPACGAC